MDTSAAQFQNGFQRQIDKKKNSVDDTRTNKISPEKIGHVHENHNRYISKHHKHRHNRTLYTNEVDFKREAIHLNGSIDKCKLIVLSQLKIIFYVFSNHIEYSI